MAGLEVALKTLLTVVAGGDVIFQGLGVLVLFAGECFTVCDFVLHVCVCYLCMYECFGVGYRQVVNEDDDEVGFV